MSKIGIWTIVVTSTIAIFVAASMHTLVVMGKYVSQNIVTLVGCIMLFCGALFIRAVPMPDGDPADVAGCVAMALLGAALGGAIYSLLFV